MRLTLDRLQATPLGAEGNRLHVGDFQIAFADTVLLIESASMSVLYTDLHCDKLRVGLSQHRILIDLHARPGGTLSIAATSAEQAQAMAYFRERGIPIVSS